MDRGILTNPRSRKGKNCFEYNSDMEDRGNLDKERSLKDYF